LRSMCRRESNGGGYNRGTASLLMKPVNNDTLVSEKHCGISNLALQNVTLSGVEKGVTAVQPRHTSTPLSMTLLFCSAK
jgi:hypothetical protein